MSTPEDQSGAPAEQPPAAPQAPPQPLGEVVDDANDLRGAHFKALLRRPLTWVLVVGLALLAGVAGAVFLGPGIGAAILAGATLLGIGVVFAIADSRAADSFFDLYASERGLTLISGRGRLPEATPLLRKGDSRYTERSLLGRLGENCEGTLALYTYEDEYRDSKGNKQTNYYRYTLGFIEVPEVRDLLPELYCQRKFGFRALEKFEDAFRGSKERVALESEAMADKYEIFSHSDQDAVWLRRLFSPTFIVWLTDAAPEKFAFELVNGKLCCYVSGHKEEADELDTVMAASVAVATRLREEAAQTSY